MGEVTSNTSGPCRMFESSRTLALEAGAADGHRPRRAANRSDGTHTPISRVYPGLPGVGFPLRSGQYLGEHLSDLLAEVIRARDVDLCVGGIRKPIIG